MRFMRNEIVILLPLPLTQVSLRNQGLKQWSDAHGEIGPAHQVRSLDLRDNGIRRLPSDLSAFSNLSELDLRGNPIQSVNDILDGLTSFPALRHLWVDLAGAQDEETIVLTLSELRSFNGVTLDDDDVEHELGAHEADAAPEEDSLPLASASRAEGTQSPSGGSEEPPVPRKKVPASLRHVPGPPRAAGPKPTQPGRVANGGGAKPTGRGGASASASASPRQRTVPDWDDATDERPPPIREIAMTEDDLEGAAVLFGALKALQTAEPGEEDTRLTRLFDEHVEGVMDRLRKRLDSVNDPFLRQSEILGAKYDLYDVVYRQAISHAAHGKGSREFGAVMRKLREVQRDLFDDLSQVLRDMRPHFAKRVSDLKQELKDAEKQTADLVEAAQYLDTQLTEQTKARESSERNFEEERSRLLRELRRLQERNAYLEMQLRQYKTATPQVHSRRSTANVSPAMPSSTSRSQSPLAGANDAGSASRSRSPVPVRRPSPDSGARRDAGAESEAGVPKMLPLKQLKDTIEAIYASKEKFDAKCREAELPRETMEQHMYTYLNQRYGLRRLIIEHASAIIRAVNRYSAEDNDVCVFGRILRNEVEEEFREVQSRLKDTVASLLRMFLKGKYPRKPDPTINTMLAERMQTVVFEEEWSDIIRYMYSQEDSEALIHIIHDRLERDPDAASAARAGAQDSKNDGGSSSGRPRRRRRGDRAGEAEVPKGAINYSLLLKIMLDFQLRSHEKFLSRFRRLFRDVDADSNGIVNEAEFRSLVTSLDPDIAEERVDQLLAEADPYERDHITFSECVRVLLQPVQAETAVDAQPADAGL